MKLKLIIIGLLCMCHSHIMAQELQAEVNIDFSQIQTSNTQIFKTLQKSLKTFINGTKWTDQKFTNQERIECSFTIIINQRPSNNDFEASLIVQSRRPVYKSDYYSTILNFQDNKFNFRYVDFEDLIFNERTFSGKNLTDVIGFYVYLILGYDADTFSKNGGTAYFDVAKEIATNAENQGYTGWSTFDNNRTRGSLISDILKPKNNTLRTILYEYHIRGLDRFYGNNQVNTKNQVFTSLQKLKEYNNSAQFYPLDIFLIAKKEEISQIFSGGDPITYNVSELKQLLENISPRFTDEYWSEIKN